MVKKIIPQNKNANNKVDISYNFWLGIRFVERELYNKSPTDATIERLKDLLEDE